MADTIELYVKQCSNVPGGLELTIFQVLSPTWRGEQVIIPFGEDDEEKVALPVVGMTDLFGGRVDQVEVTKVELQGHEGYLVHASSCGVRILDENAPTLQEASEMAAFAGLDDSHLPRGYGRPFVWIDDEDDLPEAVRKFLER